ncbi:Putative transcriptional acitvator, Baf [Thiobacillus denitrificans ATCC 25259]|uniref:Type III pantothenate kinase n=1 Tax=Thiobacillus denitrificans (strain ATCC 25259 / T1) TaxID=292415 RepID=COAX_THIDA|nr:type III pantothenate kinase [Thiobacillus denitrificans]Q3SLJ6.1 RecName: Full=Type III pantothenate kinase; AltName: Full=PanK-III; AltName: Full=Pantothenic acid kinase [Thiobacillus denitrificans ATCC 25259]AAZ96414.1 Putative transcriptional acitvator, Baf [Thiobacillus denitrificans ATCC 25259]
MSGCRILLDAGNSSLKWAVVEDGTWLARGRSDYSDLSAVEAELDAGSECFIASVASRVYEEKLAALLTAAGCSAVWLKSEAAFDDVTNDYRDPTQLGVDRWMGLVAARARRRAPTLVVSAGTAMTVDALSGDGSFLGGLIVPGVALMQRSLQQGTAGGAAAGGAWQAFPRCTADAAYSGIIAALCGAVEGQHVRLAAHEGISPACLITGGGAETLLPHLGVDAEHVPTLVLEGIERVARAGGRG